MRGPEKDRMSRLSHYQNTLMGNLRFEGIGVHSGKAVAMTLRPAAENTGIVFSRTDMPGSADIRGDASGVTATALCTVLGDLAGAHVVTIEHLMAALRAMEVDNVRVELDAAEVPVLDGSSAVYVEAIVAKGLRRQTVRRNAIRVLRPVRVENGASWGELRPHDRTRFEIEIDFPQAVIGRQVFASDLSPDVFRHELSRARTFGFVRDVEGLRAAGFARGSSLANSVVIGEDETILNAEGLRYADEFVRHKTLDAVGDLALAGAPILATYRSYRGGHALNAQMVRALLADASAWEWTSEERPAAQSAGIGMLAAAAAAYEASKL